MKSSPKKTDPATVPLSSIHLNDGKHGLPKNPRFIRDERFDALCASIRDNPEYMPARPIIVNEDGCILGGNMRFRACKANGMKTVPASWIQRVEGWSIEKQKRFIIMDNRGFGEDDMDALANEWEIEDLIAAGFEEADLTGYDVEPYGDTSTDRDGQGVTSTWESCKKTGAAPVRIGPMESRITVETAQRIVEKCNRAFSENGTPINETLEAIMLCALQS